MRTKIKNLIVFLLPVIAFAACGSNEQTSNLPNAQPIVTPTAAPVAPATADENRADTNKSIAANSNQTPKSSPVNSPTPKATATPTAAPKASAQTKYKNYNGRGVVKKIDFENSSIVIDHEDIGDYMVAMEMPFPVTNKKILNNVKVGDTVTFVLETGVGVERIISIRKN